MAKLVAKLPVLTKSIVDFSIPRLQKFYSYAKVEMRPPSLGDIPAAKDAVMRLVSSAKSGKWQQITMREGMINGAVTLEIVLWFFAGEVIGRRCLKGYSNIPGTYNEPKF